jgi:hypothetical protein
MGATVMGATVMAESPAIAERRVIFEFIASAPSRSPQFGAVATL